MASAGLDADVSAFVDAMGGDLRFERIGVLDEHIDRFDLTWWPPRSGRSNHRFDGTRSTEAEALAPQDALSPFSLVCKAIAANGLPTVKLSDNPNKAMGPEREINRYRRVFDVGVQTTQEVLV